MHLMLPPNYGLATEFVSGALYILDHIFHDAFQFTACCMFNQNYFNKQF